MRRSACLLLLAVCGVSLGADVDDPLRGSRAIDQEIEKLNKTPPLSDIQKLYDELGRIQAEADAKREPLERRVQELAETPAYKEIEKKLRALEQRRDAQWEPERKAMSEAARTLYAARHGELRGFAKPAVPNAKALGFDVLTYPRVDGSTSTQPLSVIVACRLLEVPYEWIYPEPTGNPWDKARIPLDLLIGGGGPGSRHDEEFEIAASHVVAKGDAPARERIAVMINGLLAASSSTHDAFVNLIDGKTDLVINVRGPSESERKLAAEKGVKLELTPVAKDALVFIVNTQHPTKNLSRDQLVELYSQQFKREARVPAKDGKLTPYVREPDSGSRELFDALVMKGRDQRQDDGRPELISYSMSGPFNQLTMDKNGIGYTVYYYEHFMAASPFTRTIAVDGVEPTPETIASGKYPYVVPIYAIRRAGEPADSAAARLLNWLLSDEGQGVVKESGYVPVK